MTTSKFFVSTLIAAAAMNASAYAEDVTLSNGVKTSVSVTDGVSGAGNTYGYSTPESGPDNGGWIFLGELGGTGNVSLGTADAQASFSGSGIVGIGYQGDNGGVIYNFDLTTVDASAFSGSLMVVNEWNNSTNVKVSGETWKNTTYVFAGVSHEIWKSSGYEKTPPWRMYNNAERGRDTLILSGATTFSGIQGTSKGFTVTNEGGAVVSTNAYEFIGAETAGTVLTIAGAKENSFYGTVGSSSVAVGVNMTGTGTQVFGGTNYFDVVSTVAGSTLDLSGSTTSIAGAVTNAGTLNLSGATVSLSSAISNTGTVTVSDATAFVLDNLYADGVFSVISGGTIAGWENLDLSRQTYKGVALSTGRGSSASEAGKLSMNVGDLVWSGSVSSNWNLSDANWTGEDGVFHTFDNVTFNATATAENRLVEFESGANIVVGTVSVEGEVEYSWNVGEGQTATVSGDSLTVGSGATLNLGLGHDRHVIELDFDRISVSGTLKYTNGSTTWGALELNDGGEIYLGDTVPTDGLIIDSTTVTGTAKITAGTWGEESINLGEVLGQGDLLITGTTSTELSSATRVFATDLTQYSGTISLVRGSENATKLVMSVDHSAVASSTKIAVGSGTVLAVNGVNQQETNLSGVTGTGTIEFAAVGNTSDTGGGDPSFSQIQLGNGFTGTLSVTSGVLDLLEADGASAIKEARLGGVATVNLNGGGILFRNNSGGVFTKNITVGDNGGVIRLYGNGNMSISGAVTGTGTLTHTDGGTLTFTGNVGVGTFRQVAGTTRFQGTTSIDTLNVTGGLVVFNTAALGQTTLASVNISGGTVELGQDSMTMDGSQFGENLAITVGGTGKVDFRFAKTDTKEYTGDLTLNSGGTLNKWDGGLKLTGAVKLGDSAESVTTLSSSWQKGTGIEIAGALSGEGSTYVYNNEGGKTETVTISGSDNSYSGTLVIGKSNADTVADGTTKLVVSNNTALQNASVNLAGGSKAIMNLATSDVTIAGLSGAAGSKVTTTVSDAENPTLTINGGGDFAGSIAPGGAKLLLVKTGAETLTLSGENNYKGGTTISAGTLVAANANALGTNAVEISGGQLSISDGVTVSNSLKVTLSVGQDSITTGYEVDGGKAAIIGSGKIADKTSLEVCVDAELLTIWTSGAIKQYQIFESSTLLAGDVDVSYTVNANVDEDFWNTFYGQGGYFDLNSEGVLTIGIPEPSAFGLLAGVGALALVVSRRKRRK